MRAPPNGVDAVDAMGAGNTFDGAFLAEYLAIGDPFVAGRYANIVAALESLERLFRHHENLVALYRRCEFASVHIYTLAESCMSA